MSTLKVKYWAGWIPTFENIESNLLSVSQWSSMWMNKAEEADLEDMELVVFKIPKKKNTNSLDGDTIAEIEQLLQNKYN